MTGYSLTFGPVIERWPLLVDGLVLTIVLTLVGMILGTGAGLLIALAPSCGFVVQVIKNTSLASIVGFIELTRAGQIVSNATFQPLLAFGAVAAAYFAMCLPFTLLSEWLEQRQAARSH